MYNVIVSIKTFQYRIYPNKSQENKLINTLDACRWTYNKILEIRKLAWEDHKETITKFDTINLLPILKKDNEFLKMVYSQNLQEVCGRVDLSIQGFFRRVKAGENPGYPRFMGNSRYSSFTYPQFPIKGFALTCENKLSLCKIGNIKIILHRPIEGKIKTLTIKRNPTGKWFANFTCEVESVPMSDSNNYVGIDMGLTVFAKLSNGDPVENPRFFRKSKKALAKVQRRFSKQEKMAPERKHHLKAVRLVHEKRLISVMILLINYLLN
jgi:putative transposase